MTDRQALISAIVSEPDEDTPRLVFADWLDEQRDTYFADWAALIRSQVAFAREVRYSPRWFVLATEQVALFQKRKRDWDPTWHSQLGVAAWRRGFCEAIWCYLVSHDRIKYFEQAFTNGPVRAVCFQCSDLWKDVGYSAIPLIVKLPTLGRIETLDIGGEDNNDFAPALLAAAAHRMPRLRALGLSGLSLSASRAADLLLSATIPGLVALDLSGNELFSGGDRESRPESLFHSPALSRVRWLALCSSGMTPSAAHNLAHSPVISGLRHLNLERSAYDSPDPPPFGTAGAIALADGPSIRGVEFLNLSGQRVGDQGLAALVRSPLMASIRELILRSNDIGDVGARLLAECASVAALRKLDLSDNPIGAAGTEALLASPHLAGLRILNLTPAGDDQEQIPEIVDRLRERFPWPEPAASGLGNPTRAFFDPIP